MIKAKHVFSLYIVKVFIARKSFTENKITTHLIILNYNYYDSYTLRVSGKLKKRLSKKIIKKYIKSIPSRPYISFEFSDNMTVDIVYKNYIGTNNLFRAEHIQVYEIKL